MSDRSSTDREWRAEASALSDELRAIVEALSAHCASRDDLAEAHEMARALRERLSGARRARWYDSGEDPMALAPESRNAYLDQSPIRGRLNPIAPPLALEVVERADGTRAIRGRARLGIAYEGPPRGVHGGWVAALFDDLLGATQGLVASPGVTASLTVRYRNVTPLDEELRFEAWIGRASGRRIVALATCHAGDLLTAEAEGLFVRVDFNALHERMKTRRDERT